MKGELDMSRNDWFTNIENEADIASEKLDSVAVDFVLSKYGASNIEDLSESHYSEVFSELYLMSQDY